MAASGSGKGAARIPTGNTVCVPCVLDREDVRLPICQATLVACYRSSSLFLQRALPCLGHTALCEPALPDS